MTSDPVPTGDGSTPEQRASHADRDKTVDVLRIAAGDGRLTADELEERLEAALTARTHSELAALTADLTASQPRTKDLIRIDQRFGDVNRIGGWVVPRRMEIRARGADVKLDFTRAVISHDTLHIDLDMGPGDLTLVIKPGIVIDADDVAVTLGDIKVREGAHPDVPVILQVELAGRIRAGDIVARYPRRTFRQWLRREPRPYRAITG